MRMSDERSAYHQGQRDMLAKCIAAVEVVPALAQHVDDNGMVSLVYDKGDVLATLRALQEVDTLKQEPIKHINCVDKSAMFANVKDDEKALWESFPSPFKYPRDAGLALDIPYKRVLYLCEKWSRQKRYNYGTAADLGWKE